jgi:nucleoside-diphosphate kinase
MIQWTFAMVKPDAVRRGLIGQIISRFEKKGLTLVGLMIAWPTRDLIEEHYQDEKGQPHFEDLVDYMTSGPCVPMVWEGPDAVEIGRILIGVKDPVASTPGSIRGDLALGLPKTVVHGARTPEEAERELELWFKSPDSRFVYRGLIGTEDFFSDNGNDSGDMSNSKPPVMPGKAIDAIDPGKEVAG